MLIERGNMPERALLRREVLTVLPLMDVLPTDVLTMDLLTMDVLMTDVPPEGAPLKIVPLVIAPPMDHHRTASPP